MGITDKEFEGGIEWGLRETARTWARVQTDELDEVDKNVKDLDGMPAHFKSAAWMNMAAGKVSTIFPDRALTTALKKLNIPIYIANMGIDVFKSSYQHQVDRFNQIMTGRYLSIKHEFKEAINNKAVEFRSMRFGQNIMSQAMEVLKKRQKDIPKKHYLDTHAYKVLSHETHGVIETNPDAIYARSLAGYGELCAKLKDLYEGTYDAPGFNRMTLHVYNADGRRVSFFQDAWCLENHRTKKKSCPDTQMVTLGAYTDTETLGLILDNLWRLKVEIDDGLLDDYLLMGADIVHVEELTNPPSRAIDIVTDLTKGQYPDYRAEISKADELVWPRTLQMIQGKI